MGTAIEDVGYFGARLSILYSAIKKVGTDGTPWGTRNAMTLSSWKLRRWRRQIGAHVYTSLDLIIGVRDP